MPLAGPSKFLNNAFYPDNQRHHEALAVDTQNTLIECTEKYNYLQLFAKSTYFMQLLGQLHYQIPALNDTVTNGREI